MQKKNRGRKISRGEGNSGRQSGVLRGKKGANALTSRSDNIYRLIFELLHKALGDVSLEQLLTEALDIILSESGGFAGKGVIFLADESSPILKMKARSGISGTVRERCVELEFGRCLCGRAVISGERMIFSAGADKDNNDCADGYGHYCLAIMSADNVPLGALNVYLKSGYICRDKQDEEFLRGVCKILAGIIEHKRMQEKLETAYAQISSAQQQLIEMAKLQVVGGLASGVAHEVKNPLSILLQGLDYLGKKLDKEDSNVSLALEQMRDAIRRADGIVKGLLDFASVSELNVVETGMEALINNALLLVKHKLDKNKINVVKSIAGEMPCVTVDTNKIEQVFVNLFLNAVHAMSEGGTLTIKAYPRRFDSPDFGYAVGFRRSDRFKVKEKVVAVEVEDTGKGIPEDKLQSIFDPFFTTRRGSGGTGLGLSVVKSIVDLHKGRIEICNKDKEEGPGARVTLWFRCC